MQTPLRLLLDGWSDRIKLYPDTSKIPSPVAMIESTDVLEMQTISNL